jgi:hypothetical protein
MAVGLTVHERPVELDVTAIVTAVENPLTGVTVNVDVPAELAIPVTAVGLAPSAKSWTVNVRVIEWERLLLVPVIATRTIDGDEKMQESVELPEPAMLFGETLHEVLFVLRLTTPVKPFNAVMVMLEAPVEPTFMLTLVGFPVTAKS